MQKWYPKSDQNCLQKGPKSEPKPPKWVPKAIPKEGSKKASKKIIFSIPECGQSVVNRNKIEEIQPLVLAPFWVSFWRCFGSPNGGQGHQKAPSKTHLKNDAQNDPKVVPKGVPKWSQNHQKWGLGSTLFQGWLPSGLQTPSRIDFGEVLGPCWDHFRQFF